MRPGFWDILYMCVHNGIVKYSQGEYGAIIYICTGKYNFVCKLGANTSFHLRRPSCWLQIQSEWTTVQSRFHCTLSPENRMKQSGAMKLIAQYSIY